MTTVQKYSIRYMHIQAISSPDERGGWTFPGAALLDEQASDSGWSEPR